MIQAGCLYKNGQCQAGVLTGAENLSKPATYPFTPDRSLAHLELVQALAGADRVPVTVLFDQQRLEMYYAMEISPETKTLMQ